MAAYQKGDLQAFAELVTRYEKRLWNFVRRFVGDRATAEDLLQDVFLRVVRGAGEWQPAAKFSTWIFTIARNLCTDQARRAVSRRAESLDADGESGPHRLDRLAAVGADAERKALDHEIANHVDQALGRLPVEQREIFLMREVMDMSFAEIALAVGASEPTVKSRMRYALQRLRLALAELRDSPAASEPQTAGEMP